MAVIIFPTTDFRGFWICCSAENSASNGTKFISIPFFSGYHHFFSLNNQTIIDTLIISTGCNPVHCSNTCHGAMDSFTVESLITG